MRVLIAIANHDSTRQPLRGAAQAAVDGELVMPTILECADLSCGSCRTEWFGLSTHCGTSTAMVVDRPHLSELQLRTLLHEWLDCQGTIDAVVQAVECGEFEVGGEVITDPVVAIHDLITDHLAEMRYICDAFAVGTVLSRLGPLVSARVDAMAAA